MKQKNVCRQKQILKNFDLILRVNYRERLILTNQPNAITQVWLRVDNFFRQLFFPFAICSEHHLTKLRQSLEIQQNNTYIGKCWTGHIPFLTYTVNAHNNLSRSTYLVYDDSQFTLRTERTFLSLSQKWKFLQVTSSTSRLGKFLFKTYIFCHHQQ